MKLAPKLLVAAFAVVALSAFAQTPAKDALKAITDYEKAARELPNPNYAEISKKAEGMAADAVKGIDVSTIAPQDAFDYAQLYSMLGEHKIVCDLTHKFVATNPDASHKFDAEMLMMRSCNALGEGGTLDETVKTAIPGDAAESSDLTNFTANQFADTIAKTQGYREAIKVLDQVEKEIIPPDLTDQARRGLPGYKKYLSKQHANDPDFKLPSDSVLIKSLAAMSQSGLEGSQFTLEAKKAEILAGAGKSKEALKILDDFAAKHADNSGLSDRIATTRNYLALKGAVPPALTFDRKYGHFTSLDSWKGHVVLIDTFAHWCGPCKASFPSVRKMYDDLHAQGFEVVGVTSYYGFYGAEQRLDPATEYAKMDGFMKDHNMDWPVIFGGMDNFKNYGITGIPTSILIGRDGKVIATDVGFDDAAFKELRAKVEKALSQGS